MKKRAVLLLCLIASSVAAQQAMSVLFDSKLPSKSIDLTQAQRVRVTADALRVAGAALRKHCAPIDPWDGKTMKLETVLSGSFTRKNSKQTAHVFSPDCASGFMAGSWRVVTVHETSNLVNAYLLTSKHRFFMLGNERYAVRDVNQNGYSEIAWLMVSAEGDLTTAKSLDLLDWDGAGARALGYLEFKYSVATDQYREDRVYTVYVSKGKTPTFVGLEGGAQPKLTLLSLEEPRIQIVPIR